LTLNEQLDLEEKELTDELRAITEMCGTLRTQGLPIVEIRSTILGTRKLYSVTAKGKYGTFKAQGYAVEKCFREIVGQVERAVDCMPLSKQHLD
jgi:hypothetical protein